MKNFSTQEFARRFVSGDQDTQLEHYRQWVEHYRIWHSQYYSTPQPNYASHPYPTAPQPQQDRHSHYSSTPQPNYASQPYPTGYEPQQQSADDGTSSKGQYLNLLMIPVVLYLLSSIEIEAEARNKKNKSNSKVKAEKDENKAK
eukprot:NODE_7320_length_447_cov_5.990625_g7154_i0.p1 GENE.NODE_7320_length_447_cov_5.990625_g7154_i0~~NODE_7320_length_447_cov_5.990625_g7154_i0.p1  ORF type:complete len:144 (+),score=33.10 NODE_7320_length_447_cov_5.990625_g7154_i0:3-434(+)